MGLWDWRNKGSAPSFGGGSQSSPPSVDLSGLGSAGAASSQDQGLPDRFDLNKWFNDVSGQTTGLISTAGTAPAKFAETPFSFADTAIKRIPGGAQALAQAGQSPGGQLLGAAGEVVNRVSNFVPAIINSKDAQLFKVVGDLPDSTPMTDALVRQLQHVPDSGVLNALTEYGKQTGGGLFGIGNRPMTVGEFKNELLKRGFFNDASGKPISPSDLLAQLRGGGSIYNFGDKAINDNPLVDMAGRFATDPTNALFLVPGGGLVKGAEMAAKAAKAAEGIKLGAEAGNLGTRVLEMAGRVVPRSRLIEAGAVAPRLPAPIIAAEAVARNQMALSTMKGMGLFLKEGATSGGRLAQSVLRTAVDLPGYIRPAEGATGFAKTLSRARSFTRSSTALGATNMAVNRISNTLNDLTGGNVPVLKDIAQFSADVENDRPLSNNSAWMLGSAAAFPYGKVVGEIKGKVGAEKVRALGRNAYDPLIRLAGGREALLTGVGGPENLQALADFADKQHMKKLYGDKPIQNLAGAESNPDLVARTDITGKVLQNLVNNAREKGLVNGTTRLEALQEWALGQGGFADKPINYRPTFADIMERWKQYMPVQQLNSQLIEHGAIVGLTDVLHTEHLDAAHTMLKASVLPDGTVPKKAIMSVLGDFPQLNMKDRTSYWADQALPDVPAPTWDSVRSKLNSQKADAIPIKEYYADAIANEKAAPADIPPPSFETPEQKITRLRSDLQTTTDANGVIQPGQVDRAHAIQKQLEDELAKLNHVGWVDRAQQDAAAGLDPVAVRASQEGAAKALGVEVPSTLDAMTPASEAKMQELSYKIAQINPTYAAKRAPTDQLIAELRPDDPQFLTAVQGHTALGDWLATDGPLAPVGRFLDNLFGPVKQHDLYRQSRQELYNQFVSRGMKAKQVDAWLGKLEDRVRATTLNVAGMNIELLRGIHAIPSSMLVDDFRAVPGTAKLGLSGKEIVQLFDIAGSRFERANLQGMRAGSKMGAILDRFYRMQQDIPIVSPTRRFVGRTFYPLFRFIIDPRWILMNSVESAVISSKDGIITLPKGPMSAAARHFTSSGLDSEMAIQPDTGWMFGKRMTQYAAASFDKRSLDSAEATLNTYGNNAPEMVTLRNAIQREADANLANGVIDAKQHAEQMKFATRDLASHINDLLYRVDKRGVKAGVKKTVDEQIKMHLTQDEAKVMQPLLEKVLERNVQVWTDVKHMYVGSGDRSNLERVLNSYWLYWPIGYQIKATKWLANTMLDGSFGHDNGALLAGKYALWQQQHEQQMKNNPAYAAFFNQNKTMWFMAQMLMPITPDSIGVSLSRPTRFLAESAQSQINKLLPADSRITAFTAYKQSAGGVLPTLAWFAELGPIYTANLIARLGREPLLKKSPFFGAPQPTPPEPAPISEPSTLPQPVLPTGSPAIP